MDLEATPVWRQIEKLMRVHPEGSKETRRSRRVTYRALAAHLHGRGVYHVRGWKHRHTMDLVKEWQREGKAANTVLGRISHLRRLASWIGKSQAVPHNDKYELEKRQPYRPLVRDIQEVYQHIDRLRERAASASSEAAQERFAWAYVVARLQASAGLRTKEALTWRPWADYDAAARRMHVVKGTKGGRKRYVRVVTPELEAAIAAARELVPKGRNRGREPASMIPPKQSFVTARSAYHGALQAVGLTRENALHPHAWRHAQAQNVARHLEASGRHSPERVATTVSRFLGHSRGSIIKHYVPGAESG